MINDISGWLPLKWRRPCLLCTRMHHRIETLMACYLQHSVQIRREQESFARSREYRESKQSGQTTKEPDQERSSPLIRCILSSSTASIAGVTALSIFWSWTLAAVVFTVGVLALL